MYNQEMQPRWLLTCGIAHSIWLFVCLLADKGGDEGSAEDSGEEEDAAASKQAGSAGQEATDKTPVGKLSSHAALSGHIFVCLVGHQSQAQLRLKLRLKWASQRPVELVECMGNLEWA